METLRFQNRSLVVADECMSETVRQAALAAKSLAPVLLCGESGSGKELVARLIHEKSGLRGAFVSVNCAALPDGLMEAELFGYEKGAFTGAVAQRIGKFERANEGTLLLDEVSEMPLHLQAKLLRVLQEGEVDRLGARDPIPVSARIIATTNRDPVDLIQSGAFRQDLFFRLNVIRIECPALRGRKQAIARLSERFVETAAARYRKGDLRLAPGALEKLAQHDWPGNVRELENTLERAVLSSEDVIKAESIQLAVLVQGGAAPAVSLEDVERRHIDKVLKQTAGNRSEAARLLGISARTLRNKLNG